ncbi:hypothetical protein ACYCVF_15505 [Bradyrhizobium sp. 1.29L]
MDIASDGFAEGSSAVSSGPDVLLLPDQEYVKKYRIGQKVCLLSAQRTVSVSSKGSERISARVSCPVFELASGERIMLADRKLKEIPAWITGVIWETDRGVRWQCR